RVAAEYPGRPGARYGRDAWVPAGAVLTTWLPVGPPPTQPAARGHEVRALLYDRTGGRDALVLPPGDGEKVRSRLVPYRPRAPTTAFLADPLADPTDPDSRAGAAVALVKAVRAAVSLPAEVTTVPDEPLPPAPEAL